MFEFPDQLRLLACLPQEQVRRLRLACSKNDFISVVSNPRAFLDIARNGRWDVLIFDPDVATEKNLPEILHGLADSSQPLIIYTALTRVSASAIASLSAWSLAGVVLRDFDDSPEFFRNYLARAPIEFFGAQMVERLGSNVDALPTPLRRATIATFCSARIVRSAAEYAGLSALTRRSVDRWLQRVGLSPAKWMVAAAQFLRAYPLILSPQLPFVAISRISGYGSVRALRHDGLVFTGRELVDLRRNQGGFDIIELVENALRI